MRNKIPPYKAKTLQTGNYVYGFYIEKPDNSLDSQKLSYYICCNDSDGYHEYEVDSNTLCEFTGLFNYKNIPLYENDLIRNYMSSTIYKIQKVEYANENSYITINNGEFIFDEQKFAKNA